jgi:hypothetical protein
MLATSGILVASLLLLILREPLLLAHSPEEFGLDLLAPFVYGAHWRFASLTRGYWTVLLGNPNETSVYLGLSVIGLLIYVWCRRKLFGDPRIELMFFVLLLFLVLALGPSLHVWGMRVPHLILPYQWFEWVFPPLKSSGMPVRMMVMVSLTAAVISAYGYNLLSQISRRGRIFAGILFAMLVVEYLPAPIPTTKPVIPQYVTILQALPGRDAVLDMVSPNEVQSMLYQTYHGKPIAFGYVSRVPKTVDVKDDELRSLIVQKSFHRLWQEYHFRYLVSKDLFVNKLFEGVETSGKRVLIWTDGQSSLFDMSML